MLQSLILGSAVTDQPATLQPLLQVGALPQLTELRCEAKCWNQTPSRAAFAGQLRQLSLAHGFGKGSAGQLVADPLSALQRLRLVEWQLHISASGDCATEWPVVLSHLCGLRTLVLENSVYADYLLDALDCAPSLREVRYELRYYPQLRVAKVPACVQDALTALQGRRPLLHVVQSVAPRGCSCGQQRSVAEQMRLGPQTCCPAGKHTWDME